MPLPLTPADIPVMDTDGALMNYFKYNQSPMWVFDTQTLAFLDVNESAVQYYGYSRKQFLEMTLADIRKKEENQLLRNYIRQHEHINATSSTWEHIKADGSHIWANISAFCVVYKQKAAKLVTVTDISTVIRQKHALRKTIKELTEYQHAITSSTIVSVTDHKGIIEYANARFVEISGYSEEELIGNTHRMISSKKHMPGFWKHMWETVMLGNIWRGEICNKKKNGGFYWVDSSIIPIRDEEGAIQRIISIRNDITERKEKEAAIALSEMQLDSLLNSTNSIHLLFDQHFYLQAFNRVAADFSNQRLHAPLYKGMPASRIVPETLLPNFTHFAALAYSGTNTLNREVQVDENTWWLINYIGVQDSFKSLSGIAFTAVDITGLKKAEQKIQQQNQTLKEISWKQSHIARAPVTNILAITNLLKDDPHDPELLLSLEREGQKLDTIIRGIVTATSAINNINHQ